MSQLWSPLLSTLLYISLVTILLSYFTNLACFLWCQIGTRFKLYFYFSIIGGVVPWCQFSYCVSSALDFLTTYLHTLFFYLSANQFFTAFLKPVSNRSCLSCYFFVLCRLGLTGHKAAVSFDSQSLCMIWQYLVFFPFSNLSVIMYKCPFIWFSFIARAGKKI